MAENPHDQPPEGHPRRSETTPSPRRSRTTPRATSPRSPANVVPLVAQQDEQEYHWLPYRPGPSGIAPRVTSPHLSGNAIQLGAQQGGQCGNQGRSQTPQHPAPFCYRRAPGCFPDPPPIRRRLLPRIPGGQFTRGTVRPTLQVPDPSVDQSTQHLSTNRPSSTLRRNESLAQSPQPDRLGIAPSIQNLSIDRQSLLSLQGSRLSIQSPGSKFKQDALKGQGLASSSCSALSTRDEKSHKKSVKYDTPSPGTSATLSRETSVKPNPARNKKSDKKNTASSSQNQLSVENPLSRETPVKPDPARNEKLDKKNTASSSQDQLSVEKPGSSHASPNTAKKSNVRKIPSSTRDRPNVEGSLRDRARSCTRSRAPRKQTAVDNFPTVRELKELRDQELRNTYRSRPRQKQFSVKKMTEIMKTFFKNLVAPSPKNTHEITRPTTPEEVRIEEQDQKSAEENPSTSGLSLAQAPIGGAAAPVPPPGCAPKPSRNQPQHSSGRPHHEPSSNRFDTSRSGMISDAERALIEQSVHVQRRTRRLSYSHDSLLMEYHAAVNPPIDPEEFSPAGIARYLERLRLRREAPHQDLTWDVFFWEAKYYADIEYDDILPRLFPPDDE